MKLIQKIMGLMLVPLLFTGCVKEDLDDCMNVAVRFEYYADGQDNVLKNYVENIDLYVFDQNGRFYDEIPLGRTELINDSTGKLFQLPAGKYTLVALANQYDRTEVKTVMGGPMNQAFVQHPQWQNAGTIPGQDHNYLGRNEIEIPNQHVLQDCVIRLYSAHINASVEVYGLQPPARSEGNPVYTVKIAKANAQTNLLNEVQPGQWATVAQQLRYDSQTQAYHTDDLVFFRMDHEGRFDEALCQHQLQLEDGEGHVLASFPLSDFIKENEKLIDVMKQEAYLPICIKFTPVGVTIEVPSWYIEDIHPDWT